MKKFLSLFLIGCILIPTLIACADVVTPTPDDTNTDSTSTESTTNGTTITTAAESTTASPDPWVDEETSMMALAKYYQVVYELSSYTGSLDAAKNFAKQLKTYTDVVLEPLADEVTESVRREVLIGYTNRAESAAIAEDLGYYDYQIAVKNRKLIVVAGCEIAYGWAMDKLFQLLDEDALDYTTDSSIVEYFEINPLAKDFSTFTPNWFADLTPADWMSNVNGANMTEKAFALTRPHSEGYRITSQTHRGDTVNYCEGSLESVASCIWAGIDVMEFDIQFTKDGIAILHHDKTLSRMTNADEFIGMPGYPATDKIVDWTYDQIRDLNLRSGLGGSGSSVTDYKVPTLYEGLKVAAGRIFIQIDDKTATMSTSTYGFYPIAESAGAKISFMTQYDTERYYNRNANDDNVLNTLKKWVEYNPDDTEFAAFVTQLEGWLSTNDMRGEPCWPNPSSNYTAWQASNKQVEKASTWEAMLARNYYHIWTENPVALATYIKATCRAETVA